MLIFFCWHFLFVGSHFRDVDFLSLIFYDWCWCKLKEFLSPAPSQRVCFLSIVKTSLQTDSMWFYTYQGWFWSGQTLQIWRIYKQLNQVRIKAFRFAEWFYRSVVWVVCRLMDVRFINSDTIYWSFVKVNVIAFMKRQCDECDGFPRFCAWF